MPETGSDLPLVERWPEDTTCAFGDEPAVAEVSFCFANADPPDRLVPLCAEHLDCDQLVFTPSAVAALRPDLGMRVSRDSWDRIRALAASWDAIDRTVFVEAWGMCSRDLTRLLGELEDHDA
jgi:hypothetical protein